MNWAAGLVGVYASGQLLLAGRLARYFNRSRPEPQPVYKPEVAVIVPCKEADPEFQARMRQILQQNYVPYRVIFVTGSEHEAAWPVLNQLVAQTTKAILITAGQPTGRSQKVHNQLRGLAEAGNAEVLIFADSDALYPPYWLRHLISPLDNADVGVATGCFWLEPSRDTLWSRTLAWGFNSQIVPFFAGDHLRFAWGGSMAIRTKTFHDAGIARIWQTTAYDDLPLAAAINRLGLKITFVPQALVTSPILDGRLVSCFNWLKRQLIAGKTYTPTYYFLGLLLLLPVAFMVISPLLLLASWFKPALRPQGLWLLAIWPIRMVIGTAVCLAVNRPHTARYAPLDFLAAVLGLVASLQSIFSNRFNWAGQTYELAGPDKTYLVAETL